MLPAPASYLRYLLPCLGIGFALIALTGFYSVAFYAPLVCIVALSLRSVSEQSFWMVTGTGLGCIVLPMIWRDLNPVDLWGMFLAAGSISLLGLMRWQTFASAKNTAPSYDSTQIRLSTKSTSNDDDRTPPRDHHITQLVTDPIVERLRSTHKFSAKQLEMIEQELNRVFGKEGGDSFSLVDFPAGTEIGDFSLEVLLGQGGSGQVYRARPKSGGDCVALKLLRNVRSTDRFRREMDLAQRLAHPNVVIAYEVGEHMGLPYIVMEHLAGPDLSLHVTRLGPLGWKQSLEVILQAARALEHAHQRGLVHRDVKPGNLIWDHDGWIKVSDLGLAALLTSKDIDLPADFDTLEEMIAGTPDFMAPEQARSLSDATELSDIYALGATWFYLLTGQVQVHGTKLSQKMTCLLTGKKLKDLPASAAPAELRDVWRRMTAYRAHDRYQSMTEVIAALENARPTDHTDGTREAVEILVVEDDQDDLFLTIEMLQRGNKSVTIHEAHTLEQAIEQVNQFKSLDIVLLDLQLPDSAGVETVQQLRSCMPEIPIIVLTGQDDVTVGQDCIEAGADEFACKNDLNAHILERMIFITISRCKHRRTPSN